MITPSTNSVVTARFAGAMYNLALNYSTTQQILASTSTPGAMTDVENQLFIRDFSNMATGDVATIVATNLGLTGEAFDAAVVFLTGWITGTVFTERGAVIAQIVNNFSLMTEDPTFGSFATAWNTKVGNAVAYAQNSSSTATIDFDDVPSANLDSFTLTNGTDIATANIFTAGLVYTPGGDDRINALQDEDQLTGSGTNPTLNATLGNSNDNGGVTITPRLNGIETINVAFAGSGGGDGAVTGLNMEDATGTAAINITRVSEAIDGAEVGNIMTAAASLSLSNTHANRLGTVEFSYTAGVLAGTNTGSLTLDNVTLGALNIGQNISILGPGVTTEGFETLAIQSTGAPNVIGVMDLPMDTGTAGAINISGNKSLTIANNDNVLNGTSGLVEAVTHSGGIIDNFGRLASVNASGLAASLTMNIPTGMLSTGKADTSGVAQNVTITGTGNNDTFFLQDTVQAGDSIVGGNGTDTLMVYTGGVTTGTASSIEAVDIQSNNANVTMDMARVADATLVNIRNIGNIVVGGTNVSADTGANALITLNNLTATMGAALNIQHSTTTNGGAWDTTVQANLASSTNENDLVGISINEGVNADPRFNFTLGTNVDVPATANVERVENITITDNDSESNSVLLASGATHTGTIIMTGGAAGTFLNLDVNSGTVVAVNAASTAANAGAAAAAVAGTPGATAAQIAAAATAAAALGATPATVAAATEAVSVTGLKQTNISGSTADGVATGVLAFRDTGWVDVGVGAQETRLVAGTINATGEASNVQVRVSTTVANTNGGQSIRMGSGNDIVIFDDVAATSLTRGQAGLTNADTVSGGAGTNTLVIDGGGVNVVLQQSEWDNISGFQTVYLAGNGGGNQYFLQIDNDMIAANGTNGNMITIDNDDDSLVNNQLNAFFIGATNADFRVTNTAVRLDATTLSANAHFTYDGEEGAGATADRFVVNDNNTNGGNIIDGGDVNISVGVDAFGVTRQLAGVQSADVIEVRNTATVTTADLTNVQNVGNIVINNDQAVLQTLNLSLNTAVADALSDSGHLASLTEVEALTITANDGAMTDAAGTAIAPIAASRIVLDARGISGAFGLTVLGDASFAANDTIQMKLNLGGATQNFDMGLGTDTVSLLGFNVTGTDEVFSVSVGDVQTVQVVNSTGVSTQDFVLTSVEVLNFQTTAGATATVASSIFVGSLIDDTITGSNVDDFIIADAGADTIRTGLGNDTVVLDDFATTDTVTDFAAGDILQVSVTTPAANTYFEGLAGAVAVTDEIAILTDVAGFANAAAVYAAGTFAAASEVLVVYLDTTVGNAVVYYDADGETGGADGSIIASLTGITTAAGIAGAFDAGSVTFF
ncbi:MAG: hypothetical protein LK562_13385 [Candidatus Accumulibacter phosphatis]|nr:hypothetical protein [Candidatus Accumulibacter phosphatis]